MQTEVQDTSIEALKEQDNSGQLGKRERQVYDVIKRYGPCSISVISEQLRMPAHWITGRLDTLRNRKKAVGFSHKDDCPVLFARNGDRRLVCFWKVIRDIDNIEKEVTNGKIKENY